MHTGDISVSGLWYPPKPRVMHILGLLGLALSRHEVSSVLFRFAME